MGLTTAMGALSAVTGLGQMLFSGRKKAERRLKGEIAKMPTYSPSAAVSGYYNLAKQRALTSPTQSAYYKTAMDAMRGNLAGAYRNLSMQGRGAGLAGTSSILAQANKAALSAGVNAESMAERRFGQFGGAAQALAGEQYRQFSSQRDKQNMYVNLYGQKLQAANQRVNAGMQNIWKGGEIIAAGEGFSKKGGKKSGEKDPYK